MATRVSRVAFAFLSIGWYRANILSEVKSRFGEELKIYGGSASPDPTIHLADAEAIPYEQVVTVRFPKGVFFQQLPFWKLVKTKVLLLDLNPRMVHVWLLVLVRKTLGRRTILWGHAWPREGRYSKTTFLRIALARLADAVVTYTHKQKREIAQHMSAARVYAAPNALYFRRQFRFEPDRMRNCVIYVGRLVEDKKPTLLLRAFGTVSSSRPDIDLLIVGSGSELERLRRTAAELGILSKVKFLGPIEDYDQLRDLYARAIVSVSPGYVGLSLIQSLSFGVPMLIARDEPHSPEIEAAVEHFNCSYFTADSADSLGEELRSFLDDAQKWQRLGRDIAEDAAGRYCVEMMAEGLISAVEGVSQ